MEMDKLRFKESVCNSCKFCDEDIDPIFCFRHLSKKDRFGFYTNILPLIKKSTEELKHILVLNYKSIKRMPYVINSFNTIFCDDKVCRSCTQHRKKVLRCIKRFKLQYKGKKANIILPEVSILISDNENFKKKVALIFENNTK